MTARVPMLLLLVSLALLSSEARAEIVRLADGTLVHGRITEFDESTGFTLERADTGGVLVLRWDHLPAEEVRRIKAARGFTGEEPEAYLVGVVHLILNNGTTESGILVDDGRRDVYTLRRRSGTDSFPRNYVRRVEPGKVEGLVIYMPDELYGVIVENLGTPTDVAGHFAMAVACEGAALYEQALVHYEEVQQFDPDFKADLIATRVERLAIKIEDAAETAILDDIRNRLYRKQFGQALEMVAQFRDDYPLSRQLGELAAIEQDILARRRGFVAGRIISDYFSFLGKSLSEISRTNTMSMEAAVELLESSVHEEIIQRLSRSYGLDEETLEELWNERKGGSVRSTNYGTGTFVLGEDKALDWHIGRDEEKADEEVVVTEDDDLQAKIDKVLRKRQQERAKRIEGSRRASLLDEGLTPEEWWEQTSTDDRVRWLTGYYAEYSGHLTVIRAKPKDCRHCEAEGRIQVLNEKNEYEYVTCPVCKGLEYERLVSFK